MKLESMKLENFGKFTKFEISFDEKITRLVGANGSGKTTIGITAIWACLKGIAEKNKDGQLIGERFLFIGGDKKTADVEIVVHDNKMGEKVTIRNHITKDGNHITCNPVRSETWLNELLSVAFLSAKNFTTLSSKEQALTLGIDTSGFDKEIAELKNNYTFINRELKNLGNLPMPPKTERVKVNDLVDEERKIRTFNDEQIKKQEKISEYEELLESLNEQLEEIKSRIDKGEVALKNLPRPEKLKPTDKIDDAIRNADNTNSAADKYENWVKTNNKRKEGERALENNKNQQRLLLEKRTAYIDSFKLSNENLTIVDGDLLLDGRPIKEPYFSKGELEMIVAQLYVDLNPKLKLRFIDDFDLLDESNQEKLLKDLFSKDFQVVTAEVSKKITKDNTLLLKECALVDKDVKELK